MADFISTLFGNSTASPAKLFPEGAKGEHADMPTLPEKLKLPRDFSRVILTLENVLLPDDKITMTPSRLDGVTEEIEMDLRIYGSELIQTSGGLLDLPQVAMATGQVLFQRFYYCKSFVKHNVEVVAMACVHLASKIDEAPRRIRDVMSVFHHIKQIRLQKRISSLMIDTNYINLKNQVIKEERRVLKELGFCVHVKHAHKMIVMYLQVLEQEKNRRFLQCAWNYMNDSFRTNVFVRFPPETIACSCIYLAARQLQIVLPNNPPWFALFGATESEIKRICLTVLSLYTRSKPNPEELEKSLVEVRAMMKSKTSASAPTNSSTPHLISAPGTPLEQRQDSPATSTAPSATGKRAGEVKGETNGRHESRNKSDYYRTDSRRHRSRSGSRGRREESRDDKYRDRYDRRGDKGVKRSRSPVSYKSKQRDERDVKRSRTTIDLTNDDVNDHRDNHNHHDKSYKDHRDKSGSANSDRSGKDHRDKSHKDHGDVKSSKGHRDAEPVKSHRDKSSKDHRDKSSKDHRDVEKLSKDLRDASKNHRDGYREYRGDSRDREDAKLRAVQNSRDVSPVSKHSSNHKREKIESSRKSNDLYKKDRKDIDKYDLSSYKKESRSVYNGKKSSDNGSRLLAPSR